MITFNICIWYSWSYMVYNMQVNRLFFVFLVNYISRHTIVCRAAQEAGAPHREHIDRKKENVIFTHLYLGDTSSDWTKFAAELPTS